MREIIVASSVFVWISLEIPCIIMTKANSYAYKTLCNSHFCRGIDLIYQSLFIYCYLYWRGREFTKRPYKETNTL